MPPRIANQDLPRLASSKGEASARLGQWTVKGPSGREILLQYHQFFQDEILRGILPRDDNPLIVDCGANIGLCSMWFQSEFPNARVLALEPDPAVFPYLHRNLQQLTGAHTMNQAAWVRSGSVGFTADGICGSRIEEGPAASVVSCTDLRRLLNEPVELLKLDVEGAEAVLLPHCVDQIAENVRHLHIEVHEFHDRARALPSVLELLVDAGFDYHVGPLHTDTRPFERRESWRKIVNPVAVWGWRREIGRPVVETATD